MSKTRDTGFLNNVVKYTDRGDISFVSGSTTLLSISSSGAITITGIISGSNALSASFALTASSADNFVVRQNVTASNVLSTGNITAQTLVVQTVTSSITYSSGSNIFGNQLTNVQQFTGSVAITGSLSVATTNTELQVGATGVTLGNVLTDVHQVTGSLRVTGSGTFSGDLGVGITTTSGVGNLQVGGAANASLFAQQGTDTVRLGVRASGRTGIAIDSSNATFTNRMWYIDNVGSSGTLTIGRSGLDVLTLGNTGAATFSSSVTATSLALNGSIANSGDAATLTIKQSSTTFTNGIYLERGGERNGYYMYIGNSLDSLTFRRNYFGTQSDVMSLTRDGNVGIGTDSPTELLEVRSASGAEGGIRITARIDGSVASPKGSYFSFRSGTTPVETARIQSNNAFANESGGNLIFSTGNSSNVLTERMRITSGGNVTIGTAGVPSGAAEFSNGSLFTSNNIFVNNSNGTAGYAVRIDGYSNNLYILWSNASGTDQGGVGLAYGGTSWSPVSSDARTKKNFETSQGLAEVLQIEPIKYHLLTDDDNATKRLGFKAQNIQPLIPEMVIPTGKKAEDGSDILTITPDYMLPVLVKAIQELNTKLDEANAKIAALEKKII